MTVFFHNPGKIEMDCVRISGVSVKDSKTAIGYFGTGLKFGIATLLRTGHDVSIRSGLDEYSFTARSVTIRGETFMQVHMNDEPLGFTTQLGRNWEVWQAYRELHSNCLDENGEISTEEPRSADTVIAVTGPGIEKEYLNRANLFLQHEPISSVDGLEVHSGASRYIYYRGVRAGSLPERARFTYNITEAMELSEDRNFKNLWSVEYAIESRLPAIPSAEVHSELLDGGSAWDQCLNFGYCSNPSKEFLNAAESCKDNAKLPHAARTLLAKHRQSVDSYPPCSLSDAEVSKVLGAIDFLRVLDCELEIDDLTVTETLGPSVYGLYHKAQDRIYLARQCLDNGTRFTAATLYEEWVHRKHRLKDESRGLQQFLFDRLMAMAEKVVAA